MFAGAIELRPFHPPTPEQTHGRYGKSVPGRNVRMATKDENDASVAGVWVKLKASSSPVLINVRVTLSPHNLQTRTI